MTWRSRLKEWAILGVGSAAMMALVFLVWWILAWVLAHFGVHVRR